MRRHALIVIALLGAALALAGCDKARRTPLNPSGPAGCLGCHGGLADSSGAPPNDLAGSQTGGAVGAHTAHLGNQVACEECHLVPGRIADKGHIVKLDGGPDGDGRAEVTFGSRATKAGGFSASYTPAASPAKGGSCTVYCHGASLGAAGGSNTTPTWADGPLNCGSCHGTSAAGAPPNHAPGLASTDCASCHPDTVTPGGQITTTGAHINGLVEVRGCTGCHGDATRAEATSEATWAPPKDSLGATTGARVGAHLRHVSSVAGLGSRLSLPFDCTQCHRMPTNGGPHGQAVVQWPAAGTNGLSNQNGALTPAYAGGSCASTYCHGATLAGGTNKSPAWNAAGSAGCGSCHFISGPTAPHPLSDKSGAAITAVTQCTQCHPGTVNPDGTIRASNGLHVNGLVDTSYHPANFSNPINHGPAALGGQGGLQACTACHGSTFAGVPGTVPSCTACHAAAGRPNWLTDCTFCHGEGNRAADAAFPPVGNPPVAANKAAPPVSTQLDTGANRPKVGAHLAHIQPSSSVNGALAIQIQCTECHGAVLPTDEKHADGSVAIGWGAVARGGGATPAPAEGNLLASWESNPTCTNYCHGSTLAGGTKVNPSWVAGAPEAACGTCHAMRPGSWHPNNPTCNQCHPGTVGADGNIIAAGGLHVNGRVDPVGTSCTSCHGGASGNAAPPTASTGATSGPKVGAHQPHVNAASLVGAGYACATCHPNQTSNRHANDQVDMAWTGLAVAGGVTPTPLAGPLAAGTWEAAPNSTCTNYCHGATLTTRGGNNRTPIWTAGAGQVACGTCHASPPPLSTTAGQDHPQNIACASCHGAGYAQAGVTGAARTTHVNGLLTLVVSGCTRCHGELGAANVTLAAPLKSAPAGGNAVDSTGQGLVTAPGVGAHAAHLSGTTYRASPVACGECHLLPGSDADTSHATGAGTSGARATVAFGNLATGSGASFNNELAPPAYSGSTTATTGASAGSCASTYCHGRFKNGAKATVAWVSTGGLTCNSCHGSGTGVDANLPGGNHPQGSTACGSCHTGYTRNTVVKATHIDGQLQVSGMNCSSCHGDPARTPVASAATFLDVSNAPLVQASPPVAVTAANQVGAHLAHVNQGDTAAPGALSSAFPCLTCHVVPSSGAHSDGVAAVTWGGLATNGGTASPSYDLVSHTCSSTYCHGQFTGGKQSAAPLGWSAVGKLACNACHGQGTGVAQPAHPHPQNVTCLSCHVGATATTLTAAAVAVHVDGVVNKTTAGCTACHGELSAAGVTVSPANNLAAAAPGATGTTTVDTTGQTAATSAGVGAHRAHLGAGVISHQAIGCGECHPVPAANTDVSHATGAGTGGARANVLFGAVATGAVNAWAGGPVVPTYLGSASGTGGTGGGSCAATYCHGNFRNGKNVSLGWTTVGAMTCNSCHGAGTGAAATLPGGTHPQGNSDCSVCHAGYTNLAANPATHLNGRLDRASDSCSGCHGTPGRVSVVTATDLDVNLQALQAAAPPVGVTASNQVGAHLAHVNQGASGSPLSSAQHCVSCHVVPASAGHSDGVTTVAFGGVSALGTYDAVNHSCSSTYCHGNFTGGSGASPIAWGSGSTAGTKLGCAACHGSPPAHPHPQNNVCASCHTGATATTLTAAAVATHVDGVVNKTTAGCTACHGELPAAGVTLTTNLVAAAPGATGTNTVDTVGQTAATVAGVGAHKAHLGAGVISHVAIACTECHALPPSNTDTGHANSGVGTGGARATLAWGATATRSVNAWSGAPVVPTYLGSASSTGGTAGGTCASTYCHGNFTNGKNASLAWTTVGAMTCNSCHGAGTGASATLPGGSHPQGNATCSVCHTTYTNTTADAALHMNGRLDVIAMTCTACHGDAARTPVGTATWTVGTINLVKVAPPIDASGATASNLVGAHQQHVNQGAVAPALSSALRCENCHNGLVYATAPHTTPANPVVWGNIAIAAAAVPTGYNPATKSCASTYCHGNFPGGKGAVSIGWGTGTQAKLACNACHGQGTGVAQPAHPHPQNVTCQSCHAGATATTLTAAAVTVHVDGVVNKTTAGCTGCHGELPAAGVTLTTNLVAAAPGATGTNTMDTTGLTATTAAGVGAHRAHLVGSTGTPRWRSTAIACIECHALPPSNIDTAHGNSGTGTGGARANVLFGALASNAGFGARTPAYSGSTSGAGGTTGGSCASTYCHAPRADTVTGLNQAPAWASPGTVLCGDCHGLPPVAAAHPVNALCSQCHPGYPDSPTATTVLSAAAKLIHINGSLDGGESSGATPCLNCHKTDATTGAAYGKMVSDTTVYHHVVAEGTTFKTYPLTATGQACLQCHADHDVFNPALNAANTLGRGANLRTTIATAPTKVAPASGNYANTDFSGTAGLCLSCHSGAIAKNTTAQKSDGSTTTHVVSGSLYAASAHAYTVAGSFSSGPSAFTANCMKCHSDQQTATYPEKQGGTYKFALHTSVDRRLLNPLGMTSPADAMEEKFCYRCHSASTDVTPGGGPAKTTTASDAYGAVTTMSGGSTGIFAAMQEGTGTSAGTTQAATTLYLRNTATVNTVESSLPTAYILASGTYAGTTTFSQYDMALAAGATALARTNTSGATTARYLRFGQFVSPAVAAAVTIPSGSTFLINTRAQVSAAGDTENERFQIWRRTAAGVNTALNTTTQQQATALTATATNRSYSFVTNTAVTLAPGDGLILEIETLKGSTTTSTVTENYGNFATDGASLVLPVSITFQTGAATVAAGRHDVGGYSGIHQPTEAPAGAGGTKHVECADCHEPHGATAGAKPATNNNLVWGPITGVTGVTPTWGATSWTNATAYAAVTASTLEYQICFKCHSGANAGLATWGAGDWTDLALEFNPANQSRHPVASALPATDPGANGSSQLPIAGQLVNGWVKGMVMTCSDCHGGDAASPAAQGPHGSAVKYMLKGTNRAWPYTTAGATSGTLFTMTNTATGLGTANGLFCRNCHGDPAGANTATNYGHVQFRGQHGGNAISTCVRCHLKVPHGGKVSRLIATSPNTPARYQVSGQTLNLVHFVKNNAGTYSGSSWFGTTCSTHSGGAATGEAW